MDLGVLSLQFVGTVIGAMIGAYITGRLTETGRINAVTAALAKVVEQERAKAFAQEQGKQDAVMTNLQHLNTQMATLTTTQEQIKARVSNEVWDRQWRLNRKEDLYTKLIDVGTRLLQLCMSVANQKSVTDQKDDTKNKAKQQKIEHQKIVDVELELHRLNGFVSIFGNQDCIDALDEFYPEAALNSQQLAKDWASKEVDRSDVLLRKLIKAARRELDLES